MDTMVAIALDQVVLLGLDQVVLLDHQIAEDQNV